MKVCKIENCSSPVWGKGLCKFHTPKKRLKSNPSGKKESFPLLRELYLNVWKERLHCCENCGKALGSEPLTYMFDHLLEKSKYPELKLVKENIMLVCFECHEKKTMGHPSEIQQTRIEKARQLLK